MKTAGGANALAWLFARGPRPCNTLQFSRGWDLLVPSRREGVKTSCYTRQQNKVRYISTSPSKIKPTMEFFATTLSN